MNAATMKRVIIATFTILCLLTAAAQDIIVKKSGDTLRVYDLKINAKFITYREDPGKDSPSKRIGKAKVLSVKKAKGKSVTISAPDPAPAKVKVQPPAAKVEKDTVVYFTEILKQDSAQRAAEKPAREPKGEVARAVSPDNARLVGQYNAPIGGYGSKEPKKSKAHCAVAIMGVTEGSVLANEDIEVEITKCEGALRYNIFVRNKSDRMLFVDLENCFRIFNDGTFRPYYSGKQIRQNRKSNEKVTFSDKHTNSRPSYDSRRRTASHGLTYNIENRKETSQTVKEQKILAIPPMGKAALPPLVYLDENDEIVSLYDSFVATLPAAEYGLRDWQTAAYDEARTPCRNSFIITYSPSKKMDVFSTVKFGLYVRQMIGLGTNFSSFDESRINGYDKNTICGKIYFE